MSEYTEMLEDKIREKDERERVNEAALVLLNGGSVKRLTYFHFPVATFDDVITKAMEDDTINECIKQILMIVPHSQLAQLVKHQANVVAAEALDIDVDL